MVVPENTRPTRELAASGCLYLSVSKKSPWRVCWTRIIFATKALQAGGSLSLSQRQDLAVEDAEDEEEKEEEEDLSSTPARASWRDSRYSNNYPDYPTSRRIN